MPCPPSAVSSSTSPPSSPAKQPTSFLRHLVTGVQPVSKEDHAQRWQHNGRQQQPLRSTPPATTQAGSVSAKVAVFEAASLRGNNSRAYERIPLPPSPVKTSFAPPGQAQRAGTPTSPTASTSPTVPASFFQQRKPTSPQDSRPHLGIKSGFAPQQQQRQGVTNKENHSPISSALPSPSYRADQPRHSPLASPATLSPCPSPLSQDLETTESEVSVCTMATRSSQSTHASSLVSGVSGGSGDTASVEAARVGFATRAKVEIATPRRVATSSAQEARPQGLMGGRQMPVVATAPRIVETAPTPRKERERDSRAPSPPAPRLAAQQLPIAQQYQQQQENHQSQQRAVHPFQQSAPSPQQQQRPQQPPRAISTFSEALPVSYPSSQPSSPTYEHCHQQGFQRLPLDTPASASPPGGARKRATTLSGGGAARPVMGEGAEETREEKERRVDEAFGRLLDTMQLPDPTVRQKMLSLALPLKEEMLRSASAASSPLTAPGRPTHSRGRSLNVDTPSRSPTPNTSPIQVTPVPILTEKGPSSKKEKRTRSSSFGSALGVRKTKSSQSLRASAASATVAALGLGDQPRRPSHSRATSGSGLFRSLGRSSGKGRSEEGGEGAGEDATFWAVRIRSAGVGVLEVKEVGRLRGRLRAEAPSWVEEFIRHGGYLGLLERLKELLDVEWREEQHDDQILHELLRCFKALTLTSAGRHALSSLSPTPFHPLAALLFSEKRPGDLPCRQLLVELLQAIFDVAPAGVGCAPIPRDVDVWKEGSIISLDERERSEDGGSGGVRRYTRPIKGAEEREDGMGVAWEGLSGERRTEVHRFVYSLMRGAPDEKEVAKVDFIQQAHHPRVFKVWVTELADCVRDYFWIFCHSQNIFWSLEQINPTQIEAPKVPSGMTGGVEYEAMAYCAAHFRLINALTKSCPSREEAFKLHNDLFDSGLERVLLTLRRASLVYYQSLHLEMSRYIALARSAGFNLGPRILACLDPRTLGRQEQMVLQMAREREQRSKSANGAPQLEVQF